MVRRSTMMALAAATLWLAAFPAAAQPVQALAERLSAGHPAGYYTEAARLFGTGQRDEAVFLFYLGQLRFRTHLAARPSLPRDADPAVFSALSEQVGRPINEYAFGDMPALLRTLDAVIAFDRHTPDRFTTAREFPEATRRTREGMAQYRTGLAARGDEIRAARTANGLENRSNGR